LAEVMDLQGSIGNENGSEPQSSGRSGSGTSKDISWLQDEPSGAETCPSMVPSGCIDCRTSTGEWSGEENLRYALGSNPCFFKWVLKEDDRRILSSQDLASSTWKTRYDLPRRTIRNGTLERLSGIMDFPAMASAG
jgi:hypothetical protein